MFDRGNSFRTQGIEHFALGALTEKDDRGQAGYVEGPSIGDVVRQLPNEGATDIDAMLIGTPTAAYNQ